MSNKKSPKETVLVLRTCDENAQGYGGFQWPKSGHVQCNDWNPEPICGGGLHGLLWGTGNGDLLSWESKALWMVVEVEADLVVSLDNEKVKFPKGNVVYCGDRKSATDLILAAKPGTNVIGSFSTSGDVGTSTSGYRGTSTSGYRGTSTSGYRGTSTSGYGGTSTSGYGGTSTSGDVGTSTSGYGGTSTSGDVGTSTSGYGGTSTSGYGGTSTSGYRGTSTSGDRGTSTSGYGGTSTSGYRGILNMRWYDGNRYRIATFYVGEDGIEPNVKYRLDENGKIQRVQ